MKIRLATLNDFSEFKHFLVRTCYNWLNNAEKIENEEPGKYELMTEEELNLEIETFRKNRSLCSGGFISYINDFVRYSLQNFEEDLVSRKSKIYMIEQEGEIIGFLKIREEIKDYIRIVTWACKLEFQTEIMLKKMLDLLTQQLKKTKKKENIKYVVITNAKYALSLLEQIGFRKESESIYRII